ncbi:hypothetical protein FQZ97_724580 [compost metagenome]
MTRSPGRKSSLASVKGPEPTISSICLSAGVSATRLGMMNGTSGLGLPSASSTTPKGCLNVMRKPLGPSAAMLSIASYIFWPSVSRLAQRASEAITSWEVTGAPSWNFRPGRSVKLHTLLSALALYLSTICGLMTPFSSIAKRVS